MYDIEVIDGHNYAVICEGSPAHTFLKAMNSKLVMKKLAAEPGEKTVLTVSEVAKLCKGFQVKDLKRLQDVGLIEYSWDYVWDSTTITGKRELYTFTDYGLEVMKYLKTEGGDIEIRLN
jgi:hypothetical protein